jgi:hypothetical protein
VHHTRFVTVPVGVANPSIVLMRFSSHQPSQATLSFRNELSVAARHPMMAVTQH